MRLTRKRNSWWIGKKRPNQAGKNAVGWKGEDAGVVAKHMWIRRNWPKTGICERCHKEAKTDWSNNSGKYLREDRSDWEELCRSCHVKKDDTQYRREQSRKRLVGNTLRRKLVKQFDKNGNLITVHKSIIHAAQKLGIYDSSIHNCLSGRSKSAGGYIWKYI